MVASVLELCEGASSLTEMSKDDVEEKDEWHMAMAESGS